MSGQYEYEYDGYNRQPAPDHLPDAPHDRDAWWKSILKRGKIDVPFLLLTMLLLGVGLIMLLSASYADAYYNTLDSNGGPNPTYYFRRQLRFAVYGVVIMTVVSFIPLKLVRRLRLPVIGILLSIAGLAAMKVIGLSSHGAVRWAAVGGQRFQPSELVKAAMVLGFANHIAREGSGMRKNRSLLWFIGILLIISLLLLIQPHLSATIIILLLGALMMFAGGTKWYWFALAAVIAGTAIFLLRHNAEEVIQWIDNLPEDMDIKYQLDRISAWLDPEAKKLSGGWQILQSLYAIGSGGLMGLGLGNSRQKYMYLPEEQNDYIFPIICEELGFIGASLILVLFAVLIVRGFWLAMRCRDRFEKMTIIGYTGLLAIQVFLNVGVVTNMLPSTGISLPFFSYGGTALVVQMGEVGLILSASRSIQDK